MMVANRKAREEERAIRWLRKGKRANWAAAKVGVHPSTVQKWAAKHGIELEYPYDSSQNRDDLISKKEILRLSRLTHAGKTLFTRREVAEIMECSESYVKQVRRQAKDGLL